MTFRILLVAGWCILLTTLSAWSQIVETPPLYGSQTLLESERLLREQLLYEAKRQLRLIEISFPESPAAEHVPFLQAEALARSGEYSNADAVLTSFVLSRPNSPLVPFAWFRRASMAFEQAKYPQARELFQHVVSTAEEDASARGDSAYSRLAAAGLYWTGMAYAHQGKYEEARQPLLDNVARYPTNPYADDALFALAQFAEITMDNRQAMEYYTRIINEYPYSNARLAAHIRLAQNYIILRQYTTALSELEGATTVLKDIHKNGDTSRFETQAYVQNADEQVLYLRGEAHNGGGRYEQALQMFEEFINVYPQSPLMDNVLLGAGWANLNLQKYDRAVAFYDSLLARAGSTENIQTASARLYRLIAFKYGGKREEAKQGFLGLSVLPGYPLLGEVLLELGQMYYEDGQLIEAQRALERAERESTNGLTSVRIQILLGEVQLENGNYDKAEKAFAKAEEVTLKSSSRFIPDKSVYLTEARFRRGIALAGAQRYSEAIDALNTFLGEHSSDKRADEAIFWLAESFYHLDLLRNAVDNYRKLVRNYPSSRHREAALYGQGWSEFRMKDFTKSSATFAQLLREYPQTEFALDVLTRKGDGHYLSKQYQAAADSYRQAARKAPDTEQGLYASYQLAQALYRQNAFTEAINAAQDFLRRYPRSAYADNAAYMVGWILFQQRQFDEAITEFNKVVDKYPETQLAPRIYYAIGDAYYNLGDYEKALASYQRVVDGYPNSPYAFEAVKAVQYSLVLLNREDESVLLTDQIIKANPNSDIAEDLTQDKGNIFYNGGRYKDAVAEYENFMRTYPDSKRKPEVQYWMAKSYLGIAQHDKSIPDAQKARDMFRQITEKYPDSEYAELSALEMGLASVQLNEPDKADEYFESVKKKYPDSDVAVRAGFEQAYLRQMRGDTLGALSGYRAVAEKYKGTDYGDRSRYWVAMYYRNHDQYDTARIELAQIAVRDDDLGAEAQYRIGELWLRDKNFEKARDAFLQNKERFPNNEDWHTLALIGLGEAYEQLGNIEAAKETYRLIMALRENDDFAKTAESRLARLSKTEKP